MIIANLDNKEIIAIAQAKGNTHDFKLFKDEFSDINEDILLLADSGFQGILEFHQNSLIPIKKSKNNPLTTEARAHNHSLSKKRIVIENINRRIKRLDIFYDRPVEVFENGDVCMSVQALFGFSDSFAVVKYTLSKCENALGVILFSIQMTET